MDECTSRFYASKETVEELRDSVAAKVLMIGGFAGYWNLGDVLQLRGTIRWYENGYPSAVVCPFVQLETVGGTDSLAALSGLFGTEHWILYARSEHEGAALRAQSLGLEPLIPGNTRSPTVLHIYGGGFFNLWWGDSVLNLIECVLRSFGVDAYLMSGQQVAPEFADRLSRHCQIFRPEAVGCRDEQSGLLLHARGVEASESGDDAFEEILLIAGWAEPEVDPLGPQPSFGFHLNLSPYAISTVSLDTEPDKIGRVLREVDRYLRLLLDRYGQSACPMIIGAYSDQRFQASDSWSSMDRALVTRYFPYFMGVDLVAMWKQARVTEAMPILRSLRLCVSSSYHVALLLQALHVPTYLLAWNKYYQQKQRGLMQGIRSFEEFLSGDPQELVAEQVQFLSAQQDSRARWLSRLSELMAKTLPTGSPRLPPKRPAGGQFVARVDVEQPQEFLEHRVLDWCVDMARAAWNARHSNAMQDALLEAIRIAPADVPWQVVNALRDHASDGQGHPDAAAMGRYLSIVDAVFAQAMEQVPKEHKETLDAAREDLHYKATLWLLETAHSAWDAGEDGIMQDALLGAIRIAPAEVPWQLVNALPDYASERQGNPDAAAMARYLNIVDAVFAQAMEQVPKEHKETLDAAREDLHYKATVWLLETARSAWDAGEDGIVQDALLGAVRIAPAEVPWQVVNALRDHASDAEGHADDAAIARYLNVVDTVFAEAFERVPKEHKGILDAAREDLHYKTTVWLLETARAAWDARHDDAMQDALLGAIRIAPADVPRQLVNALPDYASDAQGHPDDASIARYLNIVNAVFAEAMEQVLHEHKENLNSAAKDLTYKATTWYLDTARAAWDAGENDTMQHALLGAVRVGPSDVPWRLVNALPDYASDPQGLPDQSCVARYLDVLEEVFAQGSEQVRDGRKEVLLAAREALNYKALVWCLETLCDKPQAGVHQVAASSLLRAIRIDEEATAWWTAKFLSQASVGGAGQPRPAALKEVAKTVERVFTVAADQASADEAEAVAATWTKVKTRTAVKDGR